MKLTDKDIEDLTRDVRSILAREIGPTIGPGIDMMRGIRFDIAAEKTVELCIVRLTR